MAMFRIRNGRVQAVVRRKGFPPACETFPNKTEAKAWADSIEAGIRLGSRVNHGQLRDTTVRYPIQYEPNTHCSG